MAENANRVKEITDKLEAGIQAMFDSEAFKKYLKTLSKFHHYSLNNTILIAMQRPDATLVAGYSAWKNSFGTILPCTDRIRADPWQCEGIF